MIDTLAFDFSIKDLLTYLKPVLSGGEGAGRRATLAVCEQRGRPDRTKARIPGESQARAWDSPDSVVLDVLIGCRYVYRLGFTFATVFVHSTEFIPNKSLNRAKILPRICHKLIIYIYIYIYYIYIYCLAI